MALSCARRCSAMRSFTSCARSSSPSQLRLLPTPGATAPDRKPCWAMDIGSSSPAALPSNGNGKKSRARSAWSSHAITFILASAPCSATRVYEPMRDAVGCELLTPFTSKLNMKRAVEGSEFPYHQDYPYWYVAVGADAADISTAVVFLDDATADNGALRVLPGSHRHGPARRNPNDPTGFLADPASLDLDREITLELPAGSVVFFGAFLVHRSSPNRSSSHRRALLPSFQPAGRPRLQDVPYRPERVADLP